MTATSTPGPSVPPRRSPPADVDAVDLALTGMRRVAVVGLSSNPDRDSHAVAAELQRRGWTIVPVNPTVEEVLGEPAWPDLASVPGRIDVVDVFRRPEHLAGVAEEAVARDDVAVVWNQLGLRSSDAREVVADAGRAYVEDRCLKVEVAQRDAHPPQGPRVDGDVLLVDLDGTVLDHATAEHRSLVATLAEVGAGTDDEVVAAYRRINHDHWQRFERDEITAEELRTARWEAFVADRGLDVDGTVAARSYLARLRDSGDVLPGARAALWWLGRRARVVALTNGFDDVQRGRLAAAGLDAAFDGFVSSDGVGASKPDPAIVDAALATVGADDAERSRLVVIGDSLRSDVAVAEAVGAASVLVAARDTTVPADGPTPTHHVTALADLA